MVKRTTKTDSEKTPIKKKSTKKVTSIKQRGRVTRKGRIEIKNDNPNGKEDFEELLKIMITPRK